MFRPTLAEKFPLGQLVATPAALAAFTMAEILACVARHLRGDWGDIHPGDEGLNDLALEAGDRLMSVYKYGDRTLWILTEADRSSTCALCPEDY